MLEKNESLKFSSWSNFLRHLNFLVHLVFQHSEIHQKNTSKKKNTEIWLHSSLSFSIFLLIFCRHYNQHVFNNFKIKNVFFRKQNFFMFIKKMKMKWSEEWTCKLTAVVEVLHYILFSCMYHTSILQIICFI